MNVQTVKICVFNAQYKLEGFYLLIYSIDCVIRFLAGCAMSGCCKIRKSSEGMGAMALEVV
jgi:hypothetical protein